MGVRLLYSLSKVRVTPDDLFRYDKREKKGLGNNLISRAVEETIVPPRGEYFFSSREMRRAVEVYSEEFCLNVEDTLTAFWAVRKGHQGLACLFGFRIVARTTQHQRSSQQWGRQLPGI